MAQYEYKVVPAPRKGQKAKGHKTPESRFSLSLENVMNQHGADGWEYLRAETLPCDERSGLTGSQTIYRDVLVFRRARTQDSAPVNPPAPEPVTENATEAPPVHLTDFQTARDHADTDETAAPYPAPPVYGETDTETEQQDTDDTETPPRSG